MERERDKDHVTHTAGIASAMTADAMERTQLNKFHCAGGTGFAAEDANAAADRAAGREVHELGRDNRFNGADRSVDGWLVQTKYYETAARTIGDAFDPQTGMYRYDGMRLEVPSDQYEECVRLMQEKIKAGKVPGVKDPEQASQIVRKGSITYQQARNIARPGNLESIRYDAKQQCVSSLYAFGLSFLVTYARLRWEGNSNEKATTGALKMGLASGATSFVAGVFSRQVLRTRAAAWGAPLAKHGVRAVYKSSGLGKSAVEKIAELSLGKATSGAAAVNHVSKLLRSNVITGVITTVVVSTPDIYRAAIKGSISWAQLSKNIAVTGAGVAGGAGGAMAGAGYGAALGAPLGPVGAAAGAIVGGVVGGLAGSSAASAVTKVALDALIEDDAKEMIQLLQEYLQALAEDYLLTTEEAKQFVELVGEKITAEFLREMYASKDRRAFVVAAMEPICQDLVAKRPRIETPDPQAVQDCLYEIEKEVTEQAQTEVIKCESAGCDQRLRVPTAFAVMEVTCPTCKGVFVYNRSVPQSDEPLTDAAAALDDPAWAALYELAKKQPPEGNVMDAVVPSAPGPFGPSRIDGPSPTV